MVASTHLAAGPSGGRTTNTGGKARGARMQQIRDTGAAQLAQRPRLGVFGAQEDGSLETEALEGVVKRLRRVGRNEPRRCRAHSSRLFGQLSWLCGHGLPHVVRLPSSVPKFRDWNQGLVEGRQICT